MQAAQNAVYTEKRAAGNGANARLKVKTEETAKTEQEALEAVGAGSASLMRRCVHLDINYDDSLVNPDIIYCSRSLRFTYRP